MKNWRGGDFCETRLHSNSSFNCTFKSAFLLRYPFCHLFFSPSSQVFLVFYPYLNLFLCPCQIFVFPFRHPQVCQHLGHWLRYHQVHLFLFLLWLDVDSCRIENFYKFHYKTLLNTLCIPKVKWWQYINWRNNFGWALRKIVLCKVIKICTRIPKSMDSLKNNFLSESHSLQSFLTILIKIFDIPLNLLNDIWRQSKNFLNILSSKWGKLFQIMIHELKQS